MRLIDLWIWNVHSRLLASESNPWNFGVYALSGAAQLAVGGFSITAQQLPCGGALTAQNKDGSV